MCIRDRELLEEEYVQVRFLKNQCTSWAKVNVLNNEDGNTYVKLDFNNSMISFCTCLLYTSKQQVTQEKHSMDKE